MITNITRGQIFVEFGGRHVTIEGEALLPGPPGSHSYVVYSNSIKYWDPPFEGELIDDETREHILRLVREEMLKRNMAIRIE